MRVCVDLRGQFSNHMAKETVDLVEVVLTRPQVASQTACHQAFREARQLRIREVVDAEELARQFTIGTTIKELAVRHSISESSVKRLLRANRNTRQH